MHAWRSWMSLIVLLLVGALIGACGATATPAPPAQAPAAAATQKPAAPAAPTTEPTKVVEKVVTPAPVSQVKDGGTLNYAYPQKFSPYGSFNPMNAPAGVQAELFRMVYNRLVTWNVGATEIIPELAESWAFTPDSKTVTYKLRKDVKWHDGKPFTAKDVEYTYKLALWPKMPSTYANGLAPIVGAQDFRDGKSKEIPGIKVIDDFTISFTTDKPDAGVFLNSALLSILPAHLLASANPDDSKTFGQLDYFVKKPIGTGPYKVQNHVEDQYVEFVRNDTYFRGKPHIEKINWLILSAATVIPAGLENKTIDITANTPAPDLERFTSSPNFHMYWQPTAVYCSLSPNFNKPYLTPKALQGIAYAIDRATLVKSYLGQTAQVWDTPFGYDWLLPNANIKPYNYDLEKAKTLLKEGGWDFDNQHIEISFSGTDPADTVVFMADSLKKAGMKVDLKSSGTGAASEQYYYIDQKWDLYWGCNSWGFDPTATEAYYRSDATYKDGKGWVTGGWADKRLDELYTLGRSTLDQAQRKQYYQEGQVILNTRLPKIMIYRAIRPWVIRNNVHDATPQYHGEIPNYNAIEKWWMD